MAADKRVSDVFVPRRVHVPLGPERDGVPNVLRPLVDCRALLAGKRLALGVGLNEVLLELGPKRLKHVAAVPDDRIVAQDGVRFLKRVVKAEGQ